ncbi:TonB-dependent siderophore receptor [Hydrogenophaga sp. NFH-34]|uniref:TonB-dependent siderophore receptor n=1 Tax=Hydrogenophaga sp. NFH-34 TaxID=2744446 RepID=UPI001F328EB5|nr:TonB-dependent receptor [Hydrogenophaga sp. NFH-34]
MQRHHRPRQHAARLALAAPLTLIAAAAAIAVTLPGWAHAQAQGGQPASIPANRHHYDIPAGPLATVLVRLGAEGGLLLAFSTEELGGRQSPGVRGDFTASQALAAALTGTGLQAVPEGAGWRLVAAQQGADEAGAQTLAEVVVTGQLFDDPVTEGTGSYAGPTTTASATGLRLSIRETPQTVTVITQQQMKDQGTASISDVFQNASGISVQRADSERWGFSARGFSITNFTHDGVPRLSDGIYDWGTTNLDMLFYDRVEVIKGATGLLSGAGEPSAAVNFVRKRPTKAFGGSVTAQIGSHDHRRLEADLSTPLNADQTVRARVAAAQQDRGSQQDRYRQKLSAFYGIVEADVTPGTRLTLGADYQHLDPRGTSWTGVPVFNSDGTRTDFSRSFNPAANWSRRVFTNQSVFAMLEQQLASDWRLKVEANTHHSQHRSTLASASGGNPDPVTGEGMYLFSGDFEGDRRQNTLYASLEGKYTLFGRRHDAAFGARWTDAKTDGLLYAGQYPLLTGSIFNWDGSYPEPVFTVDGDYAQTERQTGIYASTRLRPTDRLSVILGARASRVLQKARSSYEDLGEPTGQRESATTPYLGVVYELDPWHALYASYTSIFQPQALLTLAGDYLEPLKGQALEAGVKADYLEDRVQASAAVFVIQQDNLPQYAGFVGNNEERYRGIKGVRSQGVEFQVAGRLTPAWNINASYTYNHARTAEGTPVYGSQAMTTQPEHIARLFTTYRLSGAGSGWTVGGGISWQSRYESKVWSPTASDYASIWQKGYALLDMNVRYDFTPKLSVSAVVRNLADKKYYSGMGLFDTLYYGEGRSALVTMNYKF